VQLVALWEAVNVSVEELKGEAASEEAEGKVVKGLGALQKAPGVTAELLASTGIGKKVKDLAKHKSQVITTAAGKVVDAWKKAVVKAGK
jgi:hypothetical protein